MPWNRIKNATTGNEPEGILGDKSKLDDTVLVLATAQRILDAATKFASTRGLPVQHNNGIELEDITSLRSKIFGATSPKQLLLFSRICDELRKNALKIENELLTHGHTMNGLLEGNTTYRFGRMMRFGGQCDVINVMGTVVGDKADPFFINTECPFILEILTGDSQRSIADRVRIRSQMVCLCSDAIRFGGCTECPLGDAIGLLRSAISQLRNEYAATSAYDTRDTKNN